MSFERLRQALAARVRRDFDFDSLPAARLPVGGLRHGSVLVPLLERAGDPTVLFIRRSHHMRNHPGQIAFPGGELDEGEESLAAAVREAHEEIALDPGQVEILGRLDETLVLMSPFRLTPWVAAVPYPYPYLARSQEVEDILLVPLAALARPGAHRTEVREAYGMYHEVHVYDVGELHVFGATARILTELLAALGPT
jgi:8-oxo-dGTP pyrophosphatase MutT (NUDIX family)